ncbi:MATE family efflux transporter [Lacinutrix iliipiscaria]|uniref:MATE family efflux transporter n=1 Tax=Lacinutrix iliipiscaria TaxID=1230532 RepID=A0ABW5WN04_9FLAO
MIKRLLAKDINVLELFSKGGSFFIIKVFGFLAGYIFTLLISRFYGAEVNGLVAISFSIFLIGSLIPRFGFDINLVKTFSSTPIEEAKEVYYHTIKVSFFLALFIAFLGVLFKSFFCEIFNIDQPIYVVFGFASIPLWTLTIINAGALRGLKKIKEFSFFTNAGRFVFALILLIIFYSLANYREPYVPILAHTTGLFGLTIYSFIKVHSIIRTVEVKPTNFKVIDYVKDSLPLMLSSSLILLLGWTDTIFLGVYTSSKEVGVYHVALKLAALIGFSLQSMNSILAPKIAKAYKEEDKKLFDKLLSITIKVNFFFSLGIILFLVIFRNYLLSFFGEEFLLGSNLLLLLCVGQLSNAICGPVGVVFQMTGKQKTFQNLVLGAFIINIILDLILIQPYGYYGAAISSVVSMSFWNFLGVYIIWKHYRILLAYIPFR